MAGEERRRPRAPARHPLAQETADTGRGSSCARGKGGWCGCGEGRSWVNGEGGWCGYGEGRSWVNGESGGRGYGEGSNRRDDEGCRGAEVG